MVQATPVAGAAAADAASRFFFGLTLNEWFYVSAILYSLVMTGLAVYKAVKEKQPKE
ncbi:hypothetical protein ABEQ47_12585 [Cutibacterium acnes]